MDFRPSLSRPCQPEKSGLPPLVTEAVSDARGVRQLPRLLLRGRTASASRPWRFFGQHGTAHGEDQDVRMLMLSSFSGLAFSLFALERLQAIAGRRPHRGRATSLSGAAAPARAMNFVLTGKHL